MKAERLSYKKHQNWQTHLTIYYCFCQNNLTKWKNYFNFSALRINAIDTFDKRYLRNKFNWDSRLIAIIGVRGCGKTTLLLQFINGSEKHDFPL